MRGGSVGFSAMSGPRSMGSFSRSGSWSGNRMAGRHHGHHGHRFFRNRFAFVGGYGYYPYDYYDDCYRRVWTPYGWRWRYACYY
jgi:hypothetical protein